MKIKYKIIERIWKKKDYFPYTVCISHQEALDSRDEKIKEQVVIILDMKKSKTGYAIYTPSYQEIKDWLNLMVKCRGKPEVEKALGIKIKAEKRPHGGR